MGTVERGVNRESWMLKEKSTTRTGTISVVRWRRAAQRARGVWC